MSGMHGIPAFLLAGTKSGCGKTSVTLGLVGALARRGLRVQPFKAGPDFIDHGHHARAAGLGASPEAVPVVSHNLDTWMMPVDTVRDIFARHAAPRSASGSGPAPHVAVVEGVMGLYDGFSGTDELGSSAHLAKTLGLPVVLVVDAASLARSVAAVVQGFARFDPELTVAGVILNNVASDNHAELLRQAMDLTPETPLLGLLPRSEGVGIKSRHLGLVLPEELGEGDPYARLADWVEGNLDLDTTGDGLLARLPRWSPGAAKAEDAPPEPRVRLGVARDRAFCFLYEENLRLLRRAGAEIVFFSPLDDADLPEDLDGLYLPGGYPELFAARLEANAGLRRSVRSFARSGRPVYAECGGFMYLLRVLADLSGRWYGMAGVFDAGAEMADRFQALGYRRVATLEPTLLGPAGTQLRGHEFHYSRLAAPPANARAVYETMARTGRAAEATGWLAGNTLGSYVHLHFGSNPDAARAFVEACAV